MVWRNLMVVEASTMAVSTQKKPKISDMNLWELSTVFKPGMFFIWFGGWRSSILKAFYFLVGLFAENPMTNIHVFKTDKFVGGFLVGRIGFYIGIG